MEEKALIDRLLKGDEKAYRYLVSEYQGTMRQVARAIVGDAFADEVVQEAWISVVRSLGGFEGRSSLKTWLLHIVSNHAKTRLRKEKKQIAVGDSLEVEQWIVSQRFLTDGHWAESPSVWQSETPEQILASTQLKKTIENAIDSLPDSQKTVLTLRDIEGLEITEICKILEFTESNIRVLLHRARLKVWAAIESHQKGENKP